ncbi:MAG: hypothetical protein M3Z64_02340 [Verrucomicrobiota bacterium]|nr:hypothetical protein [Verrucomicrobiota bacterium]
MRFFLRRTGLTLAAGSIICFCSCERHHVGELPREQEGGGSSEARPAVEDARKVNPTGSPAAVIERSPAGTPAQFFPTATPH